MSDVTLGVKWSEVSTLPFIFPEGEYTFQLVGGKDKNGRVEVATSIAEGEHTGKRYSFSYPNFDDQPWGIREFKRLSIALGIPIEDNETPLAYLARAVGNTFSGVIEHRELTDQTTGEKRPFAQLKLASVKPA